MPKWALPTLAVIMIAIFTYLGFWQLDRARERQSDFEAKKAQLEQKTLVLKQGDDLDTLKPYQQVSVEGRLIPSSTILLDNAILNGRAGYQVVTGQVVTGVYVGVIQSYCHSFLGCRMT